MKGEANEWHYVVLVNIHIFPSTWHVHVLSAHVLRIAHIVYTISMPFQWKPERFRVELFDLTCNPQRRDKFSANYSVACSNSSSIDEIKRSYPFC